MKKLIIIILLFCSCTISQFYLDKEEPKQIIEDIDCPVNIYPQENVIIHPIYWPVENDITFAAPESDTNKVKINDLIKDLDEVCIKLGKMELEYNPLNSFDYLHLRGYKNVIQDMILILKNIE